MKYSQRVPLVHDVERRCFWVHWVEQEYISAARLGMLVSRRYCFLFIVAPIFGACCVSA